MRIALCRRVLPAQIYGRSKWSSFMHWPPMNACPTPLIWSAAWKSTRARHVLLSSVACASCSKERTTFALLREGLRNAAQISFINLLDRARGPLARICAVALASDIETEFVHRIIKLKQLKPPPLAGPHWPWSVQGQYARRLSLGYSGQALPADAQSAGQAA